MTVATEGTDGFKRFMRSANKYGFKVKVLGMGKEWRGRDVKNSADGGHKVNLLRNELTKYKNDKNLLIMFTESHDVVLTDGPDAVRERFAKFDARVVFSADAFCWPDTTLKDKYPPVKPNEKRYLNSRGFIGYAPDLYQIVHYNALKDDGDDQSYYTSIFLDRLLGVQWNIKLDTKSNIFQNLHGSLGDVKLKYLGTHSFLYNSATATTPVVVNGNGPVEVRTEFNRVANYLADGWTTSSGCLSCQEDRFTLHGFKMYALPTILMGLFVEQPTPFIREFFRRIAALNYPKRKIGLFIHNKEELHIKDVARFLDKHSKEYRSVTHISPFSNIGNAVARNLGLEKCVEQNCQYYFSVDSVAQLTDPDTLNTLIGQNRTIISPMLSIPRTLASNFWGTLNEEGFYALSEDYMDLVEARKRGLWNVPFLMSAILIKGSLVDKLRAAHVSTARITPAMAFCQRARDLGYFMFVTNQQRHGHLINADNFETHHVHNDLYNLFENPHDWHLRYLHENYSVVLMENVQAVQDPHNEGLYVRFPTVDLDMRDVEFDRHWLFILAGAVRRSFVVFGSTPEIQFSRINIIVRYRPDEQAYLGPHDINAAFTVNIALNAAGVDFQGGGLRFTRYDCAINSTRKGWMLLHPGRLTHHHERLRVTNGTRYILISNVSL
ncbi:hypothetical protein BaRGS_00035991 [Batillaria attramentaria]|uniref:procollagen-lysine 5-dioxygenase n=1 Tax=Batillaria attramentaria TaxID=370345 RepID=A0ABD0JD17_9CAEN